MSLPPEVLETYEVLGRIREGGMGAVYKVRHRRLGAVRVVKILHSEDRADPDLIARFAREARLGGELSHPNLAQIHDLSEDGTWAVMEYIDGVPLDERLRTEGPLPVGLAVEVARQALSALAYLHRKGSVHRDVSPDNLMLTRGVGEGDGRPVVKLIDLGIAKSLRGTGRITAMGLFLGKPRYASPEQAAGDRDRIDARSDLYSLGLVLYELLTGQRAFEAGSIDDLLNDRVLREPLGFEVTDPAGRVPPDLRAVVMKALRRQPAERFASAEEMSRALAAVQARFPLDAATVAAPELAAAPPAAIVADSTRKSRPEPTAAATWRGPMPLVVPDLPDLPELAEIRQAPEVLATVPAPVRTAARPRSHSGKIAVALVVLALALLLFLGEQQTGSFEPQGMGDENSSTATAERETPAPAPILEPAAETAPVESAGGPPILEPARKQEARKVTSPGPSPSPSREVARPSPTAGSRSVSPPVEPREEAVSVPIELPRESPAPERRRSSGRTEWVSASPISVPVAPRPEAVQGYEGKVLVEVQVRVDAAGKVAETRALHVSPADLPQRADFERAALAAARQARFNPGTENGVAVESFQVLTFTFEPL